MPICWIGGYKYRITSWWNFLQCWVLSVLRDPVAFSSFIHCGSNSGWNRAFGWLSNLLWPHSIFISNITIIDCSFIWQKLIVRRIIWTFLPSHLLPFKKRKFLSGLVYYSCVILYIFYLWMWIFLYCLSGVFSFQVSFENEVNLHVFYIADFSLIFLCLACRHLYSGTGSSSDPSITVSSANVPIVVSF